MRKDINLVLNKQTLVKSIRKIFLISLVCFISTVILTIAIFVYNLSLKNTLNDLTTQEANLRNTINLLANKKSKILLYQNRMSGVNELLITRGDLNTKMLTLLNFIPAELNIGRLNSDKSQLSLGISSDSLYDVNILLEKFNTNAKELKIVKNVSMLSFSADPAKSTYNLNLQFQYLK